MAGDQSSHASAYRPINSINLLGFGGLPSDSLQGLVYGYYQCCGSGSGRIRIIWPDPDPHRDGENGSGTDPGSIKSSQNKGDKKLVFYNFLLDL